MRLHRSVRGRAFSSSSLLALGLLGIATVATLYGGGSAIAQAPPPPAVQTQPASPDTGLPAAPEPATAAKAVPTPDKPVIPGPSGVLSVPEPETTEAGAAANEAGEAGAAEPQAEAALAAEPEKGGFSEFSNITPEPGQAKPDKAPYNGSFTQVVDVKVPAFRGIEPDIDLVYDSSLGLRAGGFFAGYVGVGWQVAGLSDIVRISARQGAPAFDANDTFALDGTPLVPCATAATNASCASGGTHATRVESYRRIVFASGDNSWTVTGKDGTRSIYRPVSTWGSTVPSGDTDPDKLRNQFRWLLAQVIDTHGNTVSYSYSCGILPSCWPTQITYAGVQINFVAETVADTQSSATGRSLAIQDQRLKRIEIRVDGNKYKAYVLTHGASPISALARLNAVREFGSDFVIQPDGTVTGTALPPTTFAYSNPSMDFTTETFGSSPLGSKGRGVGDFNGDGIAEFAAPGLYYTWIQYGRYCAFAGYIADNIFKCPLFSSSNAYNDNIILDYDGDGADDFIWAHVSVPQCDEEPCSKITGGSYSYRIVRNGSSNELKIDSVDVPRPWYQSSNKMPVPYKHRTVAADFDGDGREEIFMRSSASGATTSTRLFAFNGTTLAGKTVQIESPGTSLWDYPTAPDIDGDGRAEMIYGTKLYRMGANGNFSVLKTVPEAAAVGDVNGDGKSDRIAFNSLERFLADPIQSGIPKSRHVCFLRVRSGGDGSCRAPTARICGIG